MELQIPLIYKWNNLPAERRNARYQAGVWVVGYCVWGGSLVDQDLTAVARREQRLIIQPILTGERCDVLENYLEPKLAVLFKLLSGPVRFVCTSKGDW